MGMTTEQKLKEKIKDNPSPRTIQMLLELHQADTMDKLKKTKDINDIRFYQGQVYVHDMYLELLSKVVS